MEIQYDRICAVIDVDALEFNIKNIRDKVPAGSKLYAVVKAEGYGHGAAVCAGVFEPYVDGYCVAGVDEGLNLRKSTGTSLPVLVLGRASEISYRDAVLTDITLTVFDASDAEKLDDTAGKCGRTAKVNIAVDTGMTRIGVTPDEKGVKIVKKIAGLKNITITGMFSHFESADETDKSRAYAQYEKFTCFKNMLLENGINPGLCHINNSAAIMELDTKSDICRAGIILYGLYPSGEVLKENLAIKPVMSVLASVSRVADVNAGTAVSYGHTFTAPKDMKIATVTAGYADGISRLLSNRGYVIIHGTRCPIVGRVCMDQFMADVSSVPDAAPGDEAVIIGQQGKSEITADEVAGITGTINYEVTCDISGRVPRIYVKGGKEIKRAVMSWTLS